MVLFAALRIGARTIKNRLLGGIAALAFIGIFFFDIDFPWIVLAAGPSGAIGGKLLPAQFQSGVVTGPPLSSTARPLSTMTPRPRRTPVSPGASWW